MGTQEEFPMRRVTVTANSKCSLQDLRGLDGPNSRFFEDGDTKVFDVTETQWPSIRSQLVRLSQDRVAVFDSGVRSTRTKPLLTYTVEQVPGGRQRVYHLTGIIGIGAGDADPAVITVTGENLIPGLLAQLVLKKGTTSQLALTAARKGPVGNRVFVQFAAATGAGSVAVTPDELGGALIAVVPAAAGPGAIAIAAQMNGVPECARYVSAVGGGTGTLGPVDTSRLSGGDGAGVAYLDLRTATAGSYLRLTAKKPGNQGNLITIEVTAPDAGGPSVSVTGRAIKVIPHTTVGDDDLTTIAGLINGYAAAAALVTAAAIGTGTVILPTPVKPTYLYGGAAEEPTAYVGGASAKVTSFTDTAIGLTAVKADLAGLLATGDFAKVVLLSDYGLLDAGGQVVISTP